MIRLRQRLRPALRVAAHPRTVLCQALAARVVSARWMHTTLLRAQQQAAAGSGANATASIAPDAAAPTAATATAAASAAAAPKPDVTVTYGPDGQKVVIPKKTMSRAPPGVRRKRDERPSDEDRERELKARMAASTQDIRHVAAIPAHLKKKEKFALWEVDTKKKAEETGRKQEVRSTGLDNEEKKKSVAAGMDATFKAKPADSVQLSKEEAEKEKERQAIAAVHKEWDDLMDRRISNAIAVRGNSHQTGSGRIEVNLVKSREKFKEAADMGCAESQYRYGIMCLLGEGGDVSMSHAYSYMLASATAGHPEAQWRVGVMLYDSKYEKDGIPRDPAKARDLITKSAEQGTMDAYEQLAILYRDGIGGEKNIGEAEGWHMRFEEASRDKRIHPHKYVRRWFRKKGDVPILQELQKQMTDADAQNVSSAIEQQQVAKVKNAQRVRYGNVRGAR